MVIDMKVDMTIAILLIQNICKSSSFYCHNCNKWFGWSFTSVTCGFFFYFLLSLYLFSNEGHYLFIILIYISKPFSWLFWLSQTFQISCLNLFNFFLILWNCTDFFAKLLIMVFLFVFKALYLRDITNWNHGSSWSSLWA